MSTKSKTYFRISNLKDPHLCWRASKLVKHAFSWSHQINEFSLSIYSQAESFRSNTSTWKSFSLVHLYIFCVLFFLNIAVKEDIYGPPNFQPNTCAMPNLKKLWGFWTLFRVIGVFLWSPKLRMSTPVPWTNIRCPGPTFAERHYLYSDYFSHRLNIYYWDC